MTFYTVIQKTCKFLERKKCKNNKKSTCFKGYASSHNVEIFNSFSPNYNLKLLSLQLKVR